MMQPLPINVRALDNNTLTSDVALSARRQTTDGQSRRAGCAGCVFAMCLLFGLPVFGSDIPPELDVIRQGYLENVAAFLRGKCRFTYSIQSAESEADAIAGKWNSVIQRIERTNMLYLDRDAFVIKVELDGKKIAEEMNSNAGLIVPTTIARKADFAIDHDAVINTAIVHSPANWKLTVPYHPFNLAIDSGSWAPSANIEFAAARSFQGASFEVDTNSVRDDRKYVKMTIKADYNSHHNTYWLDPARGYLQFVTESHNARTGELWARMFLLNVHEEAGAFFPTHAMIIKPFRRSNGTPYVEVREMKVDELDLSYVPTKEDMTIHLPKHTQYSDGINPNTAKSLYREGDKEFAPIHVDEIEGIYNKLQGLAVERAKEDAASASVRNPGPSVKRGSTLYWLAAINLAVVGVLVALFFRSRRRRTEKTP